MSASRPWKGSNQKKNIWHTGQNGDIFTLILRKFKASGSSTFREISSALAKEYGLEKRRVQEGILGLTTKGALSSVQIPLGGAIRKIYCFPNEVEKIGALIETTKREAISYLNGKTLVPTPELIKFINKKASELSPGGISLVLSSLVCQEEVSRIPFLTSFNRKAYCYFLNQNKPIIQNHVNQLLEYYRLNFCANATRASACMQIDLGTVAFLLRHLVYFGQLNRKVLGFVQEYKRCTFVYYLPGYESYASMWTQISREKDYTDRADLIFSSLVKEIGLKDKNKVLSESRLLFKKCLETKIIQGRSLDEVIVSVFILALRNLAEQISVGEIRKHICDLGFGNLSRKSLLATEKAVAHSVGAPLHHLPKHDVYLKRFIDKIDLPKNQKCSLAKMSLEVFSSIPKRFLMSKHPSTIAAATIYAAVDLSRNSALDFPFFTQDEVSEITGVTTVSIRNYFKLIEQFYKKSIGDST